MKTIIITGLLTITFGCLILEIYTTKPSKDPFKKTNVYLDLLPNDMVAVSNGEGTIDTICVDTLVLHLGSSQF